MKDLTPSEIENLLWWLKDAEKILCSNGTVEHAEKVEQARELLDKFLNT